MIKNIFKYFLLFLLVFILAGCEFTQQHTHEYVNGKCECGVTDPDYDPFNDTYNYVTPQTDALKLNDAWEGKDFVKDGIGEVTVSQFVDGDTAHFKTKSGEKSVEAISMFDINKAVMRCLVKNLAMFGLGLYIYAGEDLPEDIREYTCSVCGEEVKAAKIKGEVRTPKEILDTCGGMCLKCYKENNKQEDK